MTGARAVDPGRVLRRAVIGWGLGHALLGQPRLAAALLATELMSLVAVGTLVAVLVDSTWYLLPFLAGSAFLVAWAAQAVLAYRAARRLPAATAEGAAPATAAAWLTVPMLAWGTLFWLVAATAATPAAVLDRFVTAWPAAAPAAWAAMTDRPALLERQAAAALDGLRVRCAAGQLAADCGDSAASLLRDVRVHVVADDGTRATAIAELVRYERRPVRILGLEAGSELVPVPVAELLSLELAARPVPIGGLDLGARRWTIVNARAR